MVSSAFLLKCSVAIILLLQQVSAFIPSSPTRVVKQQSFSSSTTRTHDVSLLAKNNIPPPGKKRDTTSNPFNRRTRTIENGNNKSLGVGGGRAMKKKVTSQNNVKKSTKQVNGNDSKPEIDWGRVFLTFMTPWRNLNSIFLYMLIILNILGTINEAKH